MAKAKRAAGRKKGKGASRAKPARAAARKKRSGKVARAAKPRSRPQQGAAGASPVSTPVAVFQLLSFLSSVAASSVVPSALTVIAVTVAGTGVNGFGNTGIAAGKDFNEPSEVAIITMPVEGFTQNPVMSVSETPTEPRLTPVAGVQYRSVLSAPAE